MPGASPPLVSTPIRLIAITMTSLKGVKVSAAIVANPEENVKRENPEFRPNLKNLNHRIPSCNLMMVML
jgi:hypothetical protein